MVSMAAVNGTLRRVTDQAGLHGMFIGAGSDAAGRRKWRFGLPVGHHFETNKQTAAPYVTNVEMLAKAGLQVLA